MRFEVGAPALMPLTIETEIMVPFEAVAVAMEVVGSVRLAGTLAEVMVRVPLVREVMEVGSEEVPEKV